MSQLDEDIFDDPEERPGRPRKRDHGNRSTKRRRGMSCLVLLLTIALVLAAAFFAFGSLRSLIPGASEEQDFAGPGHGTVEVRISDGASGSEIGEALVDKGVVKTTSGFTEVAATQPEKAAEIQPGTYTMLKKMTSKDAFDRLLDPAHRTASGITIPEGQWRSEIYERLSRGTDVPVQDYEQAEKSGRLRLPAEAHGKVEGWLYPSTYEFEDTTAVDQLNEMIARTTAELEKAGVAKKDWARTLTLASIVEGESGDADRGKVARVVENRLKHASGPTVGKLQMDSTIHYMLQKRGTVTTSDKERNTDSPYNTYKNPGLPPGPINNPGGAAIEAAGNPDPGPWLYFVTVDPATGETRFATTEKEHQRNVQEFCRTTGQCRG